MRESNCYTCGNTSESVCHECKAFWRKVGGWILLGCAGVGLYLAYGVYLWATNTLQWVGFLGLY